VEEIVERLPRGERKDLQERLLDLILVSDNGEFMPMNLAKRLLHLYQEDSLATDRGLALILEGSLVLEREKTLRLFSEDPSLSNLTRRLKDLAGED
jgi:hypothetical protein